MPASPYVLGLREKVGTDLLFMPSAACVVVRDERMLLVRHGELDTWSFPGGALDPGERPVDAAAREVWEETGWLVRPAELLGVVGGPGCRVTYANGDRLAFVTVLYRGAVTGGEERPCADEVRGIGWFTMDELLDLEQEEWMRSAVPLLAGEHPRTPAPEAYWRPPA